MLAHDLPFGDDDDALGIAPYADGTIGEGCGHAVPRRGINAVRAQIFAHRVPRKPHATGNLPDRKVLLVSPAADDAQ